MSLKIDNDDDEIMAEINMTPLIDVMLVLLIIFMVTSSISVNSGLDIDLPQVKAAGEGKAETAVIISLTANNQVLVQGEEVELSMLQEKISLALKKEETTLVILEGDKTSKLGNAVDIIDLAKAAGASKFAIAAESK
ncbi:MAG: hypothetical protein CME70_24375 [Halobacteriovorax sp.]|nr:hypothetical protein [Halobacteriovorax sp.]|tara:strand:- start:54444 stop:54854 length:411 start_codon:yes stop_codon:yes gene_type:complete